MLSYILFDPLMWVWGVGIVDKVLRFNQYLPNVVKSEADIWIGDSSVPVRFKHEKLIKLTFSNY